MFLSWLRDTRKSLTGRRKASPHRLRKNKARLDIEALEDRVVPSGANLFANASLLTGYSAAATGSNVGYTGEAGEPNHAGVSAPLASAWWKWTAPESGVFDIDTFGSNFDTTLAIYTGNAVNSLTEINSNDDSANNHQSIIGVLVNGGTTYYIAVDGYGSATGFINLEFNLTPANDEFANAYALTGYTASASGANFNTFSEPGEPNPFGDIYQNTVWWDWTAPDNGTAYITTSGSDFSTTLGVYTGNAVNSLTEIATDVSGYVFGTYIAAQALFSAQAGTTYHIMVDGSNDATGHIALNVFLNADNNQFDNAFTLTGGSTSATGFNFNANGEIGEPNHAGASTPIASVWWDWTAPATGHVTIDTFGSDFDTTMGVYTGPNTVLLNQVASNDDAVGLQSAVNFDTVAGTTYHIAVAGYQGATGHISLNLNLLPGNDNFANAFLFGPGTAVGTNVNTTGETGEPNHAGVAGTLNSAWWQWTAPFNGTATLDTFGSNFNTVLAVYTGSSVNALTEVTSNNNDGISMQSKVIFHVTAGTTYHIAVDGTGFAPLGIIQLNLAAVPTNDFFSEAFTLTGFTASGTNNNINYTGEPGEPNHAGVSADSLGNLASAWWNWTAPATGLVTIDTTGSTFDTTLGVYTGNAVNALTQVAANDDISFVIPQSSVTFTAIAGTTYHIAVDGYGADEGGIAVHLVLAQTPVAVAGGPYQVQEGQSIVLNGANSGSGSGTISLYEWDLNYDGVTFTVDATGVAPTFSAANLDGPSTRTIALRVTNNSSLTSEIDTATVTIDNALPTAIVSGPNDGSLNQVLTLQLGAIDPSAADQSAGFTYVINWGDGNIQTIGPGLSGAGVQVAHAYSKVGFYNVAVTAKDKDGGTSSQATTPITISGAQILPDPADAAKTALFVSGTSLNDAIQIKQAKTPKGPSGTQVTLNGVVLGNFYPTGQIIVYGQGRDDTIFVNSNVTRPCILYGNAGNDSITSGGGPSILIGGDGNDTLTGNNARDILIGGQGADVLKAGKNEDILIAGTTSYDSVSSANQQALAAILAEWSRTDLGFTERMNHLTGTTPGGWNGSNLLKGGSGNFDPTNTVFNDTDVDTLTGGMGTDWFFANSAGFGTLDSVLDLALSEVLQDLY